MFFPVLLVVFCSVLLSFVEKSAAAAARRCVDPSMFQIHDEFPGDKAALWKDVSSSEDPWLGTHEALRYEIEQLEKVLVKLAKSDGLSKEDVENLQIAFNSHLDHCSAHQEQEDKLLVPKLKERFQMPKQYVSISSTMPMAPLCLEQ